MNYLGIRLRIIIIKVLDQTSVLLSNFQVNIAILLKLVRALNQSCGLQGNQYSQHLSCEFVGSQSFKILS